MLSGGVTAVAISRNRTEDLDNTDRTAMKVPTEVPDLHKLYITG